ncbi:MAG: ABC transporter ATP-binding protein [Cyclobacteriaceae bacterium]|nr:ABC transporter ATP-binding protein [Cyclobacteriaceae bacterium]
MQKVLTTEGLTKQYGSIRALDNLNISVCKGDVYGLLGPNGSGKTTTMGILLGITNAKSGTYSWFESGHGHQMRRRIGATLDKPNFYPHLSGIENLALVADIKDIKIPNIRAKLEMADAAKFARRKFHTYSTGMKQRLAIAATLLGDPEVLVLDEPTNGLDPEGIADVRELILKIAQEGITVIMSSHLLDEVQKVCTHVAVLRSGQKLYEGQVHSLLAGNDGIDIAADDMAQLRRVLGSFAGLEALEDKHGVLKVRLKDGFKASELSSFLITNGIDITHFAHHKASLEQEFLNLLSQNRA